MSDEIYTYIEIDTYKTCNRYRSFFNVTDLEIMQGVAPGFNINKFTCTTIHNEIQTMEIVGKIIEKCKTKCK